MQEVISWRLGRFTLLVGEGLTPMLTKAQVRVVQWVLAHMHAKAWPRVVWHCGFNG